MIRFIAYTDTDTPAMVEAKLELPLIDLRAIQLGFDPCANACDWPDWRLPPLQDEVAVLVEQGEGYMVLVGPETEVRDYLGRQGFKLTAESRYRDRLATVIRRRRVAGENDWRVLRVSSAQARGAAKRYSYYGVALYQLGLGKADGLPVLRCESGARSDRRSRSLAEKDADEKAAASGGLRYDGRLKIGETEAKWLLWILPESGEWSFDAEPKETQP